MSILDNIARRLGYTKAPAQSASPPERTESASRSLAIVYRPGMGTAPPPSNVKTDLEFAVSHPYYYAALRHIARASMGVPLRIMRLVPDGETQKSSRYISKATSSHVQRQWSKWPTGDAKSEWLRTKGLVTEDVDDDHELRLLLDRVSTGSTWSFLIYSTLFDLDASGNCYWELVGGDKFRPPTEIYRIEPSTIKVKPGEHGVAGYEMKANGKTIEFSPDEILHFRYPNPLDQWYGMPAATPLRQTLLTDWNRMLYGNAFFANGTQIGGILTSPDGVDVDDDMMQRRLDEFNKAHAGVKNLGKVVAMEGFQYHETGHAPKDAEFLGLANRSDTEISAVTGTPSAIFKAENINRATLDAITIQFWSDTMVPNLTFVSDLMNEFLCPRFGPDVVCEFDLSVVRALHEAEDAIVQRESQRFNDGITTIDEYREATGSAAWPEGRGQVVKRGPMDVYVRIDEDPEEQEPEPEEPEEVPADETPDTEPPAPDDEQQPEQEPPAPGGKQTQPQAASVPHSESVARHNATPRGSERHKALYKAWDDKVRPHETKLQKAIAAWGDDLRAEVLAKFETGKSLKATVPDPAILFDIDEQGNLIWRIVKAAAIAAIEEQGADMLAELAVEGLTFNTDNPVVTSYLRSKESKVKTVAQGLHDDLKRLISADVREGRGIQTITETINTRFNGLADWQAKRIAQTEVVGGMNVANFAALKQSGIEHHEWIATLDDRVRDTHVECMDQGPIPVGEPFVNGLKHPGDPAGSAAEVCNCRCTIVAVEPPKTGEG